MKYIGIDFREVGEHETGIGNYTKSIVSEMLKIDKKNVYYIICNSGSIYEKYKNIYKKNKNIKIVAIKSKTKSVLSEFTLNRELKKLKIDIFWTHIWGSIYFFSIPYTITLHDVIGVKNPQFVSLKYKIYNRFHLKWTINRAYKVFTPTYAVKDDVIEYLKIKNSKKIRVIGEGVSVPKSYYEGEDILKKYKIDKEYFIYVGNSRPHKNVQTLVSDFLLYKKKYKQDTMLVLIGVKENDIGIKNKNVKILHNINNVEKFEILKKAICFITLTYDEGFSLPILEATYSGIPVICTDIPVLREVIGDEGAIFVDNLYEDNVCEALNKIYLDKNLRENIVKEAKERLEVYTWKKSAKKVLKYIK